MTTRPLSTLIMIAHGLGAPALAQDVPFDLGAIVSEAESDTTLLQDGHVVESRRQATKVDTPLLQTPQAVTAITIDKSRIRPPGH